VNFIKYYYTKCDLVRIKRVMTRDITRLRGRQNARQ